VIADDVANISTLQLCYQSLFRALIASQRVTSGLKLENETPFFTVFWSRWSFFRENVWFTQILKISQMINCQKNCLKSGQWNSNSIRFWENRFYARPTCMRSNKRIRVFERFKLFWTCYSNLYSEKEVNFQNHKIIKFFKNLNFLKFLNFDKITLFFLIVHRTLKRVTNKNK